MRRGGVTIAGGLLLAACAVAPAQAAPITIGSPLSGVFSPTIAEGQSYVVAASAQGEPGAQAASPVSGMVIRWHLTGAAGKGFELRVLHPSGGGSYTWTAQSSEVTPAGSGLEAFPTDIPISAGDLVALYVPPGNTEGVLLSAPGSEAISWEPALAEGADKPPDTIFHGLEWGFNAEVLPPPTILSISPSSGPTAGGTNVTIAGTNLIEVKSIDFGANPARSFSVLSEGVISAIAPTGTPGPAPVSVTTASGTAVSAQPYTYIAPESNLLPPKASCHVPKLKGNALKVAKKKLKASDCKLGKVKGKGSKVKAQSPKPGKVLAPGAKVNIKLAG